MAFHRKRYDLYRGAVSYARSSPFSRWRPGSMLIMGTGLRR